jgi:hypothetical protein
MKKIAFMAENLLKNISISIKNKEAKAYVLMKVREFR